ncbi:hook complex protein, conserved [Trypanosoma cruzi]|nr:hook complex protein, conserved [Trypanosoma cruzi]
MALSLRDVVERPFEAEAMEILMDEYNKWCIGRLDDGEDDSGDDEEERNNNNGVGNGVGDEMYYGLPKVAGAFNVRALSRVEFPRTWIVPLGTIPASCYANAAVNGGSDMSLMVDYSQTRGVVRVRCELLKPTGDGGLSQKVLAVWPNERRRRSSYPSHHPYQQKEQSELYWPAFVTRVIGVFEDPLLDGSPASLAELQIYEDFDDVLIRALRSPMRVCVDVTFCIDEISEARRLTIAPAVRYPPVGASTAYDPEIARVSEQVCAMMKEEQRQDAMVDNEAQCPLLVPEVMPQVVSIRNYSHAAVAGKGRRVHSPMQNAADTANDRSSGVVSAITTRSSSLANISRKQSVATAMSAVDEHAASHSEKGIVNVCELRQGCGPSPQHTGRATAVSKRRASCSITNGTGFASASGVSKAKLNRNTLSHAPIAVVDMLAGPICQTGQFVFLRPSAQLVMMAQRAAVEEIYVIWQRLRQALFEPLYAEEIVLPSLRDESVKEATEPTLCLPDPETYVSPYVQEDHEKTEGGMPLPLPKLSHEPTYAELTLRLPILQGHLNCWTREMQCQREQRQSNILPCFERGMIEFTKREENGRKSARCEVSPSLFRTHDPDGDMGTASTRNTSYCSVPGEGGTDAGSVGGPSRTPNGICDVSVSLMSTTPGRSGLWCGNSHLTPMGMEEWGIMSPTKEPLRFPQSGIRRNSQQQKTPPSPLFTVPSPVARQTPKALLRERVGEKKRYELVAGAVDSKSHEGIVGEGSTKSQCSPTWNVGSERSSSKREDNDKERLTFRHNGGEWLRELKQEEQWHMSSQSRTGSVKTVETASNDAGRMSETHLHNSPNNRDAFHHHVEGRVSVPSEPREDASGLSQSRQLDWNAEDATHGAVSRAFDPKPAAEQRSAPKSSRQRNHTPNSPFHALDFFQLLHGKKGKGDVENGLEEPKGIYMREKTGATSRKPKMPTSMMSLDFSANSLLHSRGSVRPGLESIAVRQECRRLDASELPREGLGETRGHSQNRSHSTSHIRSEALSRTRSPIKNNSMSQRYTLVSWRDASGVEINLDDAFLLPSAVAAEAHAKLGPRPTFHVDLRPERGKTKQENILRRI